MVSPVAGGPEGQSTCTGAGSRPGRRAAAGQTDLGQDHGMAEALGHLVQGVECQAGV
jgi:hypothetical protein